jgi:hypothetical protein
VIRVPRRLVILLFEEVTLSAVRRHPVRRRAVGRRGGTTSWLLPSREHQDRPITIDDKQAGEERPVAAVQLDARRGCCHLAQPDEQLVSLRGVMAKSPPEVLEQSLPEELGYEEGQIASDTAATRRPATAAATPFLSESFWRTRATKGTAGFGVEFGAEFDMDGSLGAFSAMRWKR